MEILAALLNAQFGAAQVDAEQCAVLLEVRPAARIFLTGFRKSVKEKHKT